MMNCRNFYRHVNPNYKNLSPHPSQNDHHQKKQQQQKKLQTINAGEYKEKTNFVHCWLNYKLVQPLSRTVWIFLKKLKIEKNRATIWFSNLTPGHISRENHTLKRYMHLNVYCSTIYKPSHGNNLNVHRQMNA